MIRAQASQSIGAQMISALDGSAFTGTVTIYITGDAGIQAIGSVGSGICTHEGNGYHTYLPAAEETDYALIAFTFIGTNAIPATIQVATETLAHQAALSAAAPLGVITSADLCTNILQRLGAIQAGEAPDASDQRLVLDRLNAYIDGLANESLTKYEVRRVTWDIEADTASYLVGPGTDIDIVRPVNATSIDRVTFIDAAVSDVEMRLTMLTPQAYESIILKTQSSAQPGTWYYNPTHGPAGQGTLTLWPVPNQDLTGVIYTAQPVAQLGLSTTITLPPGYQRFLETNLAVEVAPEFSIQPSQILLQAARESKASIKGANTKLMDLSIDPALTGHGRFTYSIFTDC